MVHVTTDFMAIPKEYEWSEDLDLGLYSIADQVCVVYHPDTETYDVYARGYFDCSFSLEKYWIFINGELRNDTERIVKTD